MRLHCGDHGVGYEVTLQAQQVSGNAGGRQGIPPGAIIGANNLIYAPVVGGKFPPMPPDTLTGTDPHLIPLEDNGGGVLTNMIRSDSPTVDAGNNIDTDPDGPLGQLTHDQRGLPREVGAAPDIGAVERQGPLDGDLIFAAGFDVVAP